MKLFVFLGVNNSSIVISYIFSFLCAYGWFFPNGPRLNIWQCICKMLKYVTGRQWLSMQPASWPSWTPACEAGTKRNLPDDVLLSSLRSVCQWSIHEESFNCLWCQGRTHMEVTSELVLKEEVRVCQAGHRKSRSFWGKTTAYTKIRGVREQFFERAWNHWQRNLWPVAAWNALSTTLLKSVILAVSLHDKVWPLLRLLDTAVLCVCVGGGGVVFSSPTSLFSQMPTPTPPCSPTHLLPESHTAWKEGCPHAEWLRTRNGARKWSSFWNLCASFDFGLLLTFKIFQR